jgi:hypothetical protein
VPQHPTPTTSLRCHALNGQTYLIPPAVPRRNALTLNTRDNAPVVVMRLARLATFAIALNGSRAGLSSAARVKLANALNCQKEVFGDRAGRGRVNADCDELVPAKAECTSAEAVDVEGQRGSKTL